ncbi:hypothetical protein EMIHUDRAFT_213399 [Emiliania huxleyi CCMP1516]|uniref:Uncharacterized protein n=2 Tax=Emiliania huxleyi TaxID=2903 RepID=A0A0D3IN15_EMIH1|nr:hypothetical protein EMIHUDRAFT_213399 [Emiliania huxleyi CCMP1516]EOD12650.1 hypothetical protein EMIHUDRAFT_213399 [Emiliania huxleyi CCMP1516]|eukprot:XP_005765079.1 hypothetical protein EMIHUDRAFT_213399 [Emiliania huxleyi CCMP1516]
MFLYLQERALKLQLMFEVPRPPGVGLHAADFVRNLLLSTTLGLPDAQQEAFYLRCWLEPFEMRVGHDATTLDRVLQSFVDSRGGERSVCGDADVCQSAPAGSYSQQFIFTPTVIDVGGPVAEIALGYQRSCATLTDGTLKCWGKNDKGQVGDGHPRRTPADEPDLADVLTPTDIPVGGAVAEISLGYQHTCASLTDGTLKCWGDGDHGQLGVPGVSFANLPQPVTAGGTVALKVAKISLGEHHTCATFADGRFECWGRNTNGQLGDGTTNDARGPTAIKLG